MATKVKLPPIQDVVLDAYQGYKVFTANAKYIGTVFEFEFANGKAVIEGLPADADRDEVAERIGKLEWFLNGSPAKLPVGHELDGDGKVVQTYEWKRPYRFELDGKSNAPRAKAKASAPTETDAAKEPATAGAAS